MIRAIIEDGQIRPLEPLLAEWIEGRQVIVDDAGTPPSDDLEEWYRELQELGPARYESDEWERVQATLAEANMSVRLKMSFSLG